MIKQKITSSLNSLKTFENDRRPATVIEQEITNQALIKHH